MKIIIKLLKYLYLFLFLIYIILQIHYQFIYYNSKVEDNKLLIEIDITFNKGERGPYKFINSINEILPYSKDKCIFIASKFIYPTKGRYKSDYFYIPFPRFNESIYNESVKNKLVNKLILGPIFVPNAWKLFPNKYVWKERRFPEIIKAVKGIGVHSNRVRNYLAQKSNTIDMIKKFKIIRPCSNIKPKNVNQFKDREIDILFFEKYKDFDHTSQGVELLKMLKNSYKIVRSIKYGYYKKDEILKVANNSKFIVYFSFFDTGAIGLKEIQNYGVFAFSHQLDLVIDNNTSFFVPELADKNSISCAYKKIIEIIEMITKSNPNCLLIAKRNQEINKCENALDDLCNSLFDI